MQSTARYITPCDKYPKDHPQVQWFLRKSHGLQHIVRVTAMIYFSKSLQNKISKEERHMERCLEETSKLKLPRVLSQWSYTGYA